MKKLLLGLALILNIVACKKSGSSDTVTPTISGTAFIFNGNSLKAIDINTHKSIWEKTYEGYINTITSMSPVVENGVVFVGDNQGIFHALDAATGAEKWSFNTVDLGNKQYFTGSCPMISNGKIYICSGGDSDGYIFALDVATGKKLWQYKSTSIFVSSPTVVNNLLYVGFYDGSMRCINGTTGADVWKYNFSSVGIGISSSPLVVDNKVIYSSSSNKVALDAKTGDFVWSSSVGVSTFTYTASSMTQAANTQIIYYDNNGSLFGLNNLTGKQLWTYSVVDGAVNLVDPFVKNNIVYTAHPKLGVVAFDITAQKLLWTFSNVTNGYGPVTVTDNAVYVQDPSAMYVIDINTGKLLWNYEVGTSANRYYSAVTIVSNGKTYYSSRSGSVN